MKAQMIQGIEKIENQIILMLNGEKEKLLRDIQGMEDKYLYVAFYNMNEIFGRVIISKTNGGVIYPNMDYLWFIKGYKGIIDTILEANHTTINPPKNVEEFNFIGKKQISYFNISSLFDKLNIQRNWPTDKAIIDNGDIKSLDDPTLLDGLRQWIQKAGTEPEWGNWFPKTMNDIPDLTKLLDEAFQKVYSIELKDLNEISNYLETIAKNYQEQFPPTSAFDGKFPLLNINKKGLYNTFSKNMNRQKASIWINKLRYKPWGNIYMSPLFRLKSNKRNKFYALAHWVLNPYNQFWSAWFDDLMTTTPQTPVQGTITSWFGPRFEVFVDKKIGESDFEGNVVINFFEGKEWKIRVHDFPQIATWLLKIPPRGKINEFGIDKVIIKDKLVFFASCKAREFMLNRRLLARDYFFPIPEMMKRIRQNIEDMGEIDVEAYNISQDAKILESVGIKGDYLIPIVLSPFAEPLSFDSIRDYVLKNKCPIPNIQMITIFDFIKILRKPDVEILKLSFNKYKIN